MDRSRHCRGRMKGDFMKIDLKGKVALVTGGGRGIGRVIATQLAENGARVTIATRTEASGREVAEELRAKGGTVELVALDLSTRAACDTAVQAAVDAFGRLGIVVHNSAIFPFTPRSEEQTSELQSLM